MNIATLCVQSEVSKCLFLGHLLLGLCSLSETILESTSHGLHVTHAASTSGTTALGLFTPIVLTHLLAGVSTGRARLFLNVKRHLTASAASGVRLVVSLTE